MHRRTRIFLGQGQRRRGAALLMTVLVTLAAATIAVVATRAALQVGAQESSRADIKHAQAEAEDLRDLVETSLYSDPLGMFATVLDEEAPRVCSTDGTTVEPGAPWPATCGLTWSYDTADVTSGALLSPPSATHGRLRVVTFATAGSERAGLRTEYAVGGRTRPLIYSGSGLDLAALSRGNLQATLAGPAYATGPLDPGGVSTAPGALLASEDGFAGSLPAGDALYASGAGSAGPPHVLPMREVYASPMPPSELRTAAARLADLACGGVCLSVGAPVPGVSPEVVVPADTRAYLLVPDGDSLALHTSSSLPLPTKSCTGCQLASLPGSVGTPSFWGAPLATFAIPPSGIVSVDRTTLLGLCGEPASGAPCLAATHSRSFTVVVGSPTNASDLLLSGPVAPAPGSRARAAVVVSGDVLVPFWANGSDEAIDIGVSVVAMGRPGQVPLRSLPTGTPHVPRKGVTLNGAVLLRSFDVDVTAFEGFRIEPDAAVSHDPPPFLPGPGLGLARATQHRLGTDALDTALTP